MSGVQSRLTQKEWQRAWEIWWEMHSDPRRGNMDIVDVGKEAMIHWNGPPLAMADRLGKGSMDRIFGRGRWNFTTMANKADSVVTKRLKKVEAKLPFFN